MRLHDTYLRIADCFFMQRQYSSSEKYYSKAIDFGFFDIDYAIYKRAQSLGLLNRYSSMENLLLTLINDYTSSSYYDDALHDLSQFYKHRSNDKLAIEYYNKLLSHTNDENFIANAYLSKGMIYFKQEKFKEAEPLLERSYQAQRTNCITSYFLGRTYYAQKKLKESAQVLDQAVKNCESAKFEEPLFYSAMAYYEQGQKMQAKARAEELVLKYNKSPLAKKAEGLLNILDEL